LSTLIIACGDKAPVTEDENHFTGARLVRVATAEVGTIERVLNYSGSVRFDNATDIIPAISGRIDKIHVREGMRVARNQLIAEIDSKTLAQHSANFDLAEKNYIRAQNLFSEGAIDQRSFEEMENMYLSVQTLYEQAKQNLIVRAPFSGVITQVNFRESEIYNPMLGQGIARLISSSGTYIEVMVSDADANILATGQKARVHINNATHDGRISFISPESDRISGLNRIKIDLLSQNVNLRYNQFATVELIPESRHDTIIIPRNALIEPGKVILAKQDRSLYREVVTGMECRHYVEILSGLSSGYLVIIEGNSGLEDNYPVTLHRD
jgi:membrane fusion protein (multidrug efflux system)